VCYKLLCKYCTLDMLPLYEVSFDGGYEGFIFLLLENYGVWKLEAVFAVLIAMAILFAWMFGETKASGKEVLIGILVPKLSSITVRQAVEMVTGNPTCFDSNWRWKASAESDALGKSRIGADEWLRVPSVEDVFALGDCVGFLEQTGKQVLPAPTQGKFLDFFVCYDVQ
ncbi:hypothetical protein IFM89_001291, partial [Coptis chinensis]